MMPLRVSFERPTWACKVHALCNSLCLLICTQALEDELFERGLSMPGVTMVPWLSEMTVGAALATASHGSSLVGPSTLGPYLVKAVLVDGTGGDTLQMRLWPA